MSAMLFVSIISYLIIGVLSDRMGMYTVMSSIFIACAAVTLTVSLIEQSLILSLAVLLLGFLMVGNFTLAIKLLTSKGGEFSQPLAIGYFNTVGLGLALFFTWLSGKLADYADINTVLYVVAGINLIVGVWTLNRIRNTVVDHLE